MEQLGDSAYTRSLLVRCQQGSTPKPFSRRRSMEPGGPGVPEPSHTCLLLTCLKGEERPG